MQPNWERTLVEANTSIIKTLEIIADNGIPFAMVVDASKRLLGTVTDGDIRRGLLNRIDLQAPIDSVMHSSPLTAGSGESPEQLKLMMERYGIFHIPLISSEGDLVGLESYRQLIASTVRENWVFLMAGGFGTRLSPLTDSCPKPMLLVNGRPILESILRNFIAAGFRRFYISVHYLPEIIKSHFGDGSRWGVVIRYIEESTPLGTGGALGLLPELDEAPIIVMNGDVLTQLDFNALLDFHLTQSTSMTLCVRQHEFQMPFGVVEGTDTKVTKITEKPVQQYMINAGIYVISPRVLRLIEPSRRIDMPDLVQELLTQEFHISMFLIHEAWIDVGRPDDYVRAQRSITNSNSNSDDHF